MAVNDAGSVRDPERFKKTYWSDIKGMYFTGDGARRDKDGYFWIMGRVDDVINVSGHRLGTMEVESALVSHPYVAEAAVVGKPDEIKGSAICAFVTLEGKRLANAAIKGRIDGSMLQKKSALWQSPTIFDSPTLFPKQGAEKLCAVYCERLLPGAQRPAIQRHLKIFQFWKNCVTMKTKNSER